MNNRRADMFKRFRRRKKQELDIHGRPIIADNNKLKKQENLIKENDTISNIISPIKIKFDKNNAIIGDNLARCYGIIKYPQYTDYGWLRRLMNIHGTVATMYFHPLNSVNVLKNLSSSIKNYRSDLLSGQSDPLKRQRSENIVKNAEKAMKQIDQDNEVVGAMSLMIMPIAEDERDFKKLCKEVENSAMIADCKIRNMATNQKEAMQFSWPTYTDTNIVYRQTANIMPISAFIGGFPFAATGHNDNDGYYLGHDAKGGPITVSFWKKGGDRTNSNCLFAGESGQGKSTSIKNFAMMEWMNGASVFIIDPESEYKDLTLNLDGDWINAAGANGKVINPLEVFKIPNDEDEFENTEESDLAKHMRTLEVFLQLCLYGITQRQMELLKSVIEGVYNDFGITWETNVDQLSHNNFPVFKDVYQKLENLAGKAKEGGDSIRYNDYRDLMLLIRDIAVGSDSFLWGNHTTLEFQNDIVCVDTTGLNSAPNNIKAAQYYLLQNYAWQCAAKNRKKRSILIYDEAHMIIDKDVPQPMKSLSEQMRRARKYETAIWVASQQIHDFLAEEIRLHGQVILDQPTYKFMHGIEGQDLEDISNLFNLKPTEKEVVEKREQGRALFFCGPKKYDLKVVVDQYKFDLMGDKGGK